MRNFKNSLTSEQMDNTFEEVSRNSAINIMVQWQVYRYGKWYCIESWETRYIYKSNGKFDWVE